MQESQNITPQLFHKTSIQDSNKLSAKKIPMNYPHKLKTQAIQEYQALNFLKKENSEKRPVFDKPQQDFKRKHCIVKPIKNKFNQVYLKLTKEGSQNFTTEEKSSKNPIYPNLVIKRSGSTAPGRNRLNSQSNKQNHLNQQEKPSMDCNAKQKNLIKQSVSSIFHYHNNSLQKISNRSSNQLIRFKSKPHLIFCSSKLPKDFFGESVEGEKQNQGHQYKFLLGNHRNSEGEEEKNTIKKLKYTTSVKLMRDLKNCNHLVEKLHFDDDKESPKQKSSSDNQPEFTFRKQKSRKNIDLPEQTLIQTPKFQHKRQFTSITKQNQSLPNLIKNINMLNCMQPQRKLHRNYSKQQLKL